MSGSGHDKTQVLSAPPTPAAPPARHGPRATLHCVDTSVLKDGQGAEILLDGEPVGVGRGKQNTVALNAHGVSRRHARVFLDDGVWHVEDLGSTNGTRVNNSRIERCALNDGDTVAFGRVCYKYHVAPPRAKSDAPPPRAARAASSHDIDLGSDDKTVNVRSGQSAAAPPAEEAAEPVATRPAVARPTADTGSHARVKAGAAKESNSTSWLLIVLAAAAVVAGGAYALGFI